MKKIRLILLLSALSVAFVGKSQLVNKSVYEYAYTVDTLKGADNSTFTLPVNVEGAYDYCYTINVDSINHKEAVTVVLYEQTGGVWGKRQSFKLTSKTDTTIAGQVYGVRQKLYLSQLADTTKVKVGVRLARRF